MKKSCANCAFCIKCKDYWTPRPIECVMLPSQTPDKAQHLDYKESNLSESEIKLAEKGDFSFLDTAKNTQEQWEATFKRRFDFLLDNPRMPRIEYYSMPIDELCGMLDMPRRPIAPTNTFLRCWHEQWTSRDNPEILKSKNCYKCRFYYPIKGKGTKSFDCCYREQQDDKNLQTMKIAAWTLIATVAGIVLSLLFHFI